MTLDTSAADRGRIQGAPVGWSCFPEGDFYFVVRVGVVRPGQAGGAERRAGWFAHGRAWPLDAFDPDFDPGLYLGNGAAFLDRGSEEGAETAPGLPPPSVEPLDPILAGRGLAVSLLVHLFHGMATGYSTILAVPVASFVADSPLARIVAFARGALPSRLSRRCRIRIFARDPGLFLGPAAASGSADLLVIPEGLSALALMAAGRRALLLDERGERHHGPEPDAGLTDYARAVLEGVQRFPTHLTRFAERFDRQLGAIGGRPDLLPGLDQTRWAALTYNLTAALAGTEAQCGSLFANLLLDRAKTESQLPWSTLIRPEDWTGFPQEPLIRFILRADDDLTEGERRLQEALVLAFQQRGATVDSGLAAWWSPSDPRKRQRLLDLSDLKPALISAERSTALVGEILADSSARLAEAIFRSDGTLGIPQTPGLAVLLLGREAVAGRLLLSDLLALGDALPEDADAALDTYYRRLNDLMREDPETVTAALIRQGSWLHWRRRAEGTFDREALRQLALAWMESPAFSDLRDPESAYRPPQWRTDRPDDTAGEPADTSRETWYRVLNDLAPLGLEDIRRLTGPKTHWPWIHPFQQDQIQDLAARCVDADALAALAAIPPPGTVAAWTEPVIAALAGEAEDDEALTGLCERVWEAADRDGRSAETHPLIELAQAIRDLPAARRRPGGPLMERGWRLLRGAMADDEAFYDWALASDGRPILPLVRVAVALRPEPRPGELGRWLMTWPESAPWRGDERWWDALIGSLLEETAPPGSRHCPRPKRPWEQPEATRRAALALIRSERDALPEAESRALGRAWKTHGHRPDPDRLFRST